MKEGYDPKGSMLDLHQFVSLLNANLEDISQRPVNIDASKLLAAFEQTLDPEGEDDFHDGLRRYLRKFQERPDVDRQDQIEAMERYKALDKRYRDGEITLEEFTRELTGEGLSE